jgi:DNA-binding response OmpR family regulator
MKILLIDDSRFLRTAIERALAKAGHEVIGIADGREALVAARSSLPALILLDMMLPGLEGTSVLKELKQDTSTSHIPVIVLTGLSQKNETRLREAGAAGYVEKSSLDFGKNADVLVQAIATVLGTGELRAAAGRQRLSTADTEGAGTEARLGAPEGAA